MCFCVFIPRTPPQTLSPPPGFAAYAAGGHKALAALSARNAGGARALLAPRHRAARGMTPGERLLLFEQTESAAGEGDNGRAAG